MPLETTARSKAMRYNRLGTTGLFVSELSLGTMTFGGSERFQVVGAVTQGEANQIVARAFEAGVNLFDTADTYSEGLSEQITGEALRSLEAPRERFLVATKVFGHTGTGPNDRGASRAHIMDGVKATLKRLGFDHIDLYQIHGFDPATPLEETLRALDDLVCQGHVRYVGVSNWAAWQIAKALGISQRLGITRFDSLQAYYSVAGRDLEREIIPMLRSEGVGLLVWSPLAGGFLSGKFGRDREGKSGDRRAALEFPPVNKDRAYVAIDVMRGIADSKGVSVAQIALAWLLQQPAVTSVILGAKRLDQLDDNLASTNVTLSAEEIKAITAASALPPEYPRWMIDFQGAYRAKQLAEAKR
jgi:aryl-alcohol dehydrogenase-like predicted oxidoreductase